MDLVLFGYVILALFGFLCGYHMTLTLIYILSILAIAIMGYQGFFFHLPELAILGSVWLGAIIANRKFFLSLLYRVKDFIVR